MRSTALCSRPRCSRTFRARAGLWPSCRWRATGVRIVGIQRAGERITNPDGKQTLEAGDNLLVAGTLNELRAFRRWLKGDEAAPPLA